MENWHPSIVFDVNQQRQAERRAASARRTQVQPVGRQPHPVRTALAALLVALASRLAPTALAAGPATTAPISGTLA